MMGREWGGVRSLIVRRLSSPSEDLHVHIHYLANEPARPEFSCTASSRPRGCHSSGTGYTPMPCHGSTYDAASIATGLLRPTRRQCRWVDIIYMQLGLARLVCEFLKTLLRLVMLRAPRSRFTAWLSPEKLQPEAQLTRNTASRAATSSIGTPPPLPLNTAERAVGAWARAVGADPRRSWSLAIQPLPYTYERQPSTHHQVAAPR
jgi:hypothetical protein